MEEIWVDSNGVMWVYDPLAKSVKAYKAIPYKVGGDVERDWVYIVKPSEKNKNLSLSLCTKFKIFSDPRKFEIFISQFELEPRYPTINPNKFSFRNMGDSGHEGVNGSLSGDVIKPRSQSERLPTACEVKEMLKEPYFQGFCQSHVSRGDDGIIRIPTSDMDQWDSTRCLIVEVMSGQWKGIKTSYQDIKINRSVGQGAGAYQCPPLMVLFVRDEKLPFARGQDFVLAAS